MSAAVGWADVNALGCLLGDEGHTVCQLHVVGEVPPGSLDWSHDSHTATVHQGSTFNGVVTSDGTRFVALPDGGMSVEVAQ